MKLSVKWLAGLAVLVLAVVAVVGSTSATKAATGTIFVVNEWSTITNESPAPTGRITRSSVYATINDGTRLIETNADLIRVVVKDSDLNLTTLQAVTAGLFTDSTDSTPNNDTVEAAVGNTAVITIQLTTVPIAGTLADVQANTSIRNGATELNAGKGGTALSITNFFAGGGGANPWISVVVNTTGPHALTDIDYQTSSVNTVVVTVKSELETTGVTIVAEETGLSTGVFEGFVRLVPSTATSTDGTVPTGGALDGTPDPATQGLIRTSNGPVTATFDDAGTNRVTTVLVDTSAPAPSISGPASGSATQVQRPTFSGAVTEGGSGLDVSSIQVIYDRRDDAANGTAVVTFSAPTVTIPGTAGVEYIDLAPSTSGAVDGDTAFSFSSTPTEDLPQASITNPDHIVDWFIKATDLAGNIGVSDADASATGIQLPTVKIDRLLPSFSTTPSEHRTGLANSPTGEVAARNSLRIVFNDQVTNIQTTDFTVTLDSSAVVVPTSVTVVNNPTTPSGFTGRSLVYLGFGTDLVSNETPVVALQDLISDLAGNTTQTGSVSVGDGIAPKLTVTPSGGSGTGQSLATGEGPDALTKDKITFTIDSDEPLSGSPIVKVYRDGQSTPELTPTALAQGANKWTATYAKPGTPVDGIRAVEISGTDTAANSGTVGSNSSATAGTPSFRLDSSIAAPTLSVGGAAGASPTTDQTRPSIIIDYKAPGEASTVTLKKVQLDGTDITPDVIAASDGKRFFYIPPTDLTLGEHTLLIADDDAVDAAGNTSVKAELKVTIEERKTFDLDMFAGWNAISFPSDPVDPDINAVFDNAGHDAVLGFDPTVDGQWVVAIRDSVSGLLEPATENGLTSVRATQAYWVHSLNFEQVKVLLVGEVLPASGSPPGIITIQTVLGFNAVPVVDTSRKLTTGAAQPLTRQVPGGGTPVAVLVSDYLGAVVEGRVYRWDPEVLSFVLLSSSDAVNTGDVLFVEVTGTPVPIFP